MERPKLRPILTRAAVGIGSLTAAEAVHTNAAQAATLEGQTADRVASETETRDENDRKLSDLQTWIIVAGGSVLAAGGWAIGEIRWKRNLDAARQQADHENRVPVD